MIHDKLRQQLLELCADLGPEDGTPAHVFHRPRRARRADHRRQRQLCRAVRRAVELALAAAEAEALNTCRVEAVDAADPSHVRIEVSSPEPALAQACLSAARGWLRTEVAAALNRKRVPHLRFVVALREGGEP